MGKGGEEENDRAHAHPLLVSRRLVPLPLPPILVPLPQLEIAPKWLDSCYATCRLYSVFCMILDSDDGITFDIFFMVKYRGWQKCWYI